MKYKTIAAAMVTGLCGLFVSVVYGSGKLAAQAYQAASSTVTIPSAKVPKAPAMTDAEFSTGERIYFSALCRLSRGPAQGGDWSSLDNRCDS